MTTDVTLSGQAQTAAQTNQNRVTLAEDFDQFLQLLTTQLQNQDPLSPLDSNEFTNQLVQFSQVEQSINTNSKLDDLVALQLSNSVSAALGYVGLDASYLSPEVPFDGTNSVNIRYSLDGVAETSNINIFDSSGQLVFSGDAEKTQGIHDFTWNGTDLLGETLPADTYTVRVEALDAQEDGIGTTTVITARVRGIEQQNGTVFALVGDRAVPVDTIINATTPPPATTDTDDEGGADDSTP